MFEIQNFRDLKDLGEFYITTGVLRGITSIIKRNLIKCQDANYILWLNKIVSLKKMEELFIIL